MSHKTNTIWDENLQELEAEYQEGLQRQFSANTRDEDAQNITIEELTAKQS